MDVGGSVITVVSYKGGEERRSRGGGYEVTEEEIRKGGEVAGR